MIPTTTSSSAFLGPKSVRGEEALTIEDIEDHSATATTFFDAMAGDANTATGDDCDIVSVMKSDPVMMTAVATVTASGGGQGATATAAAARQKQTRPRVRSKSMEAPPIVLNTEFIQEDVIQEEDEVGDACINRYSTTLYSSSVVVVAASSPLNCLPCSRCNKAILSPCLIVSYVHVN